jgi:hypothetical protein
MIYDNNIADLYPAYPTSLHSHRKYNNNAAGHKSRPHTASGNTPKRNHHLRPF